VSNERLEILFPIGRFVQGSLTEMQTTDADGKPLKVKNGPNAGQDTERSFFAVAIAKIAGHTHWAQTEWGLKMWNAAAAAWPQGQSGSPSFAFKVEDGDSAVPNTKGKKNCDRPGFPGHWILNFGSGYPVKLVNGDGTVVLTEAQAKQVKLGHFIQAFGSYVTNSSALKPGMYLNHAAVSYQGFGEEIHLGIDTTKVGFGAGAKPAGMSAVPVGGVAPGQMAAAAGAPPIPAAAAAAPPIPTGIPSGAPPIPGAAAAPPTAVAPAAPFVQSAAAPPPPAAPAPPAADPVTTTGIAYASYIAQGWTVAQMKAQGVIA
jgi:hypothetical protein